MLDNPFYYGQISSSVDPSIPVKEILMILGGTSAT